MLRLYRVLFTLHFCLTCTSAYNALFAYHALYVYKAAKLGHATLVTCLLDYAAKWGSCREQPRVSGTKWLLSKRSC